MDQKYNICLGETNQFILLGWITHVHNHAGQGPCHVKKMQTMKGSSRGTQNKKIGTSSHPLKLP